VDILDDMGVSKLSAKVFFKVNYSFKMLNKILNLTFENHANEFSYNEMNIEENYIYFSFSKQKPLRMRFLFFLFFLFFLGFASRKSRKSGDKV